MSSALPSVLPLVKGRTLVWRKRTGQVFHENNYEIEVHDMVTDTALRFWEQTMEHGELTSGVKVLKKRGMSIQVFDGKWANNDSQVEVMVPCGHHPDSYTAAYGLASELGNIYLAEERRQADEAMQANFGR